MSNKIKDEILTMLIEHCRILYSVLSDMGVYYSSWAEDYESNKESLEKKKNNMQLLEEDADVIKTKIIQEFAEAGSQGLGDYIALTLQLDNVINCPLEFVDLLSNIPATEEIDKAMKKRYRKYINNIMKMADVLKQTIKNLRDNPSEVFNNTTTIHEIENDIDLIYREFLNYIYDNQDLNIRVLLRVRDSIIILEELADRIHDIADLLRILLYS